MVMRSSFQGGATHIVCLLVLVCLQSTFFSTHASTDDDTTSSTAPSLSFLLHQPFTKSFSHLEHSPCVSVFVRDGRLGCSTPDQSVAVGRLVYFNSDNSNQGDENYVMVLEDFDLTAANLQTIVGSSNLQGILVLNSTDASFTSSDATASSNTRLPSTDALYPQGYGTPSVNVNYGNVAYAWNSLGEGIRDVMDLYGVPMAYVGKTVVADSLRRAAASDTTGSSQPVLAEFQYYMGPAEMNSFECLAWRDIKNNNWNPKCLPIGGNSVWALAGKRNQNSSNNQKVILIAAGMDATSLFTETAAPGANSAASHILTVLLAAKLIGDYTMDVVDKWNMRIAFALFAGESYGFVGSRSFLRDTVSGFRCDGNLVRSRSQDETSEYGCLQPLRPSMRFASMGQIAGMIAVDQVGYALSNGILYAHYDQENEDDGEYGAKLANLLQYSGTNTFSVASSSVEGNGGGENNYPYPPSPLTSLLQISNGQVGGVVLTG